MSHTRAEFINRVLDNLGIVIPGQAPSDESVSKVDDILDAALASLAAREIVFVFAPGTAHPPSGGEYEDAIFMPLADCIAQRVSGSFNLAGDPSLKTLETLAIDELRVISRPARSRKHATMDLQLRSIHRNIPGTFSSGT
jgi:hypothetical protein